jgi:hypothetical protein
MVGGLHIPIGNRTKKPLVVGLSGVGRRFRERDDGGNVNNVHYKSNQNCHYESPQSNEYILIKNFRKRQGAFSDHKDRVSI